MCEKHPVHRTDSYVPRTGCNYTVSYTISKFAGSGSGSASPLLQKTFSNSLNALSLQKLGG